MIWDHCYNIPPQRSDGEMRRKEPQTQPNQEEQSHRTSEIANAIKEYQIVNVPGDGNCFFHCLNDVIPGQRNPSGHKQYRTLICGYILSTWDEHKAMVEVCHGIKSQEQYQETMLKRSGYATSCEVQAAANLLKCSFNILLEGRKLHNDGTRKTTYYNETIETDDALMHITLLLREQHYSILMPPEQTALPPVPTKITLMPPEQTALPPVQTKITSTKVNKNSSPEIKRRQSKRLGIVPLEPSETESASAKKKRRWNNSRQNQNHQYQIK
ncbi:uncharacterized protein LOC135482894 [Lineus longissimus]|uniref:uncharacterized protein LOC135482894 n=1 Tax=Lineus longissimus TaxID=88925 RepID=UPI00315D3B08